MEATGEQRGEPRGVVRGGPAERGNKNATPRGGGGNSHIKRSGMLVPRRGQNLGLE